MQTASECRGHVISTSVFFLWQARRRVNLTGRLSRLKIRMLSSVLPGKFSGYYISYDPLLLHP